MKKRINSLYLIVVIFLSACAIDVCSQGVISLKPNSVTGIDAMVSSLNPNGVQSNGVDFLATAWTNGGNPVTARAYINFDIGCLPANAIIDSVFLSLYGYDSPNNVGHSSRSGSNESVLQRVLQSWDENTITWNNQPPTTSQNQVTLLQSTSENQHYLKIDITQLFRDMLTDPTGNHGFRLKLKTEQYYRSMLFATSDNPDSTLHPELLIKYSNATAVNVNLGNDTNICFNESLLLSTGVSNADYLWPDSSTNPTFQVSSSGLYWVEVDSGGCISRDSINVIISPPIELSLGVDTGFCSGDTINLSNQLSGTGTYTWSNGSNASSISVSSSGKYSVQLNQGDCFEKDTVNVVEYFLPQKSLPVDTMICFNEALVLTAGTPNSVYLWNNGSTESSIGVNDTGIFYVSISNPCGYIIDSTYIKGKECGCEFEFPNVITSNGDRINDEFKPVYQCNVISYDLKIFNRWGALLYRSNQINEGWGGIYNEENVSAGNYVYSVRLKVAGEIEPRKYIGSFMVIK